MDGARAGQAQSRAADLGIGDQVVCKGTGDGDQAVAGILRFKGLVDFAAGTWLGVELREPVGENNGSVKGKRYFDARPNFGQFYRPENVARADGADDEDAGAACKVLGAAQPEAPALQLPLQEGQALLYFSVSTGRFLQCKVTAIRGDHAVQIDLRGEDWLEAEEQRAKLRSPAPAGEPEELAGAQPAPLGVASSAGEASPPQPCPNGVDEAAPVPPSLAANELAAPTVGHLAGEPDVRMDAVSILFSSASQEDFQDVQSVPLAEAEGSRRQSAERPAPSKCTRFEEEAEDVMGGTLSAMSAVSEIHDIHAEDSQGTAARGCRLDTSESVDACLGPRPFSFAVNLGQRNSGLDYDMQDLSDLDDSRTLGRPVAFTQDEELKNESLRKVLEQNSHLAVQLDAAREEIISLKRERDCLQARLREAEMGGSKVGVLRSAASQSQSARSFAMSDIPSVDSFTSHRPSKQSRGKCVSWKLSEDDGIDPRPRASTHEGITTQFYNISQDLETPPRSRAASDELQITRPGQVSLATPMVQDGSVSMASSASSMLRSVTASRYPMGPGHSFHSKPQKSVAEFLEGIPLDEPARRCSMELPPDLPNPLARPADPVEDWDFEDEPPTSSRSFAFSRVLNFFDRSEGVRRANNPRGMGLASSHNPRGMGLASSHNTKGRPKGKPGRRVQFKTM